MEYSLTIVNQNIKIMKHFLVSVIEYAEQDGNNNFTDFRLFSSREKAEDYYNKNLETFLSEKGYGFSWYDWDVEKQSDFQRNTYTWEGGANHWEIQLTELEEK